MQSLEPKALAQTTRPQFKERQQTMAVPPEFPPTRQLPLDEQVKMACAAVDEITTDMSA